MEHYRITDVSFLLGIPVNDINTWTNEFKKHDYQFELTNHGHVKYTEEDMTILGDLFELLRVKKIGDALRDMKLKFPSKFKLREEDKKHIQIKQEPIIVSLNNEEQASIKQLWALYLASGKTVDTRQLKLSKRKAGELIGRSKNGENVQEEIRKLEGAIVIQKLFEEKIVQKANSQNDVEVLIEEIKQLKNNNEILSKELNEVKTMLKILLKWSGNLKE